MENVRRACSFFLARLRSEVDRLNEAVYPGHHPGPHKWLNLVAGLIDTAEDYLQQAKAPSLSTDAISGLIEDAEDLGELAYELLMHMAGADASYIPHQIVAPFQRWVDGLGINNTIFFRAEHAPNYELWTVDYDIDNLNDPSASLKRASAAIDWPVLRVTVPSHALGMLPHFAVVAHELGHAIDDDIKINQEKYEKDWLDCIADVRRRLSDFDDDDLLMVQEVLGNWVVELKSDAVGLLVAGPAFYLALCGFLELSGRGYGIGTSHPPSEMRRRFLLKQLAEGGQSFIQIFEKHTGLKLGEDTNSPHIMTLPDDQTLFEHLSDDLGERDARICVALVPLVEKMADDIFLAAKAHLKSTASGSMIYSPGQLDKDLQRHLEPLCALIPPIEYMDGGRMRATTLSSVLNIGWAALLTKLDEIPVGSDDGDISARRMERLHALLLKAVELSEARQLWDEQQ